MCVCDDKMCALLAQAQLISSKQQTFAASALNARLLLKHFSSYHQSPSSSVESALISLLVQRNCCNCYVFSRRPPSTDARSKDDDD